MHGQFYTDTVGPGSKDNLALTTAFACTVRWSLKPGFTVCLTVRNLVSWWTRRHNLCPHFFNVTLKFNIRAEIKSEDQKKFTSYPLFASNTNNYRQDAGESKPATISTKLTDVILAFNDLMFSCITPTSSLV